MPGNLSLHRAGLFPAFDLLERNDQELWPVEDKITEGIRVVIRTRQVPTWAVVATQIFLDVHHIMRSEVERGYEELVAACERGYQTLTALYNHLVKLPDKMRPHIKVRAETTLKLKQIFVDIDWIQTTMARVIVRDPRDDLENIYHNKAFHLLKSHPLLCGLMMFRLRLLLHGLEHVLEYQTSVFVASAFLYDGAKERGACGPWRDMEAILDCYGAMNIFVGARPTSCQERFKRLKVFAGASVSIASKGGESVRGGTAGRFNTPSRADGQRKLPYASVSAQLFMQKYGSLHPGAAAQEEGLGLEHVDLDLIFQTDQETRNDSTSGTDKKGTSTGKAEKKAKQRQKKRTPLKFLKTLQRHLDNDNFARNFDMVAMHIRCTELLQKAIIEFGDRVKFYVQVSKQKSSSKKTFDPQDSFRLNKIVGALLAHASFVETCHGIRPKAQRNLTMVAKERQQVPGNATASTERSEQETRGQLIDEEAEDLGMFGMLCC